MPTYHVYAGLLLWGEMRRAAVSLGLEVSEGPGWLGRTFVFSGPLRSIEALDRALRAFEAEKKEIT